MPIRIRCRDKPRYRAQQNEYKERIQSLVIALKACCGQETKFPCVIRINLIIVMD